MTSTFTILGAEGLPPLPEPDASDSGTAACTLPDESTGVYTGDVVPDGRDEVAFRYRRFVRRVPGRFESSHLTWHADAAPGEAPLVHQRAVHSQAFELERFEEQHAQTGVDASVEVLPDGSLRFTTVREGARREAREGPGAPVVVGPTLFGYALEQLPKLARGERLPVRFALAASRRSHDFHLVAETDHEGTLRVHLQPDAWWLGLFLGPIYFDLDATTGRVLRYQGPVPPRQSGRGIDARVHYRFAEGAGLRVGTPAEPPGDQQSSAER